MKETINQETVSNISISDFTKKGVQSKKWSVHWNVSKKSSNPHLCSRTFLYSKDVIKLLDFYILI
jgi:hypothetical protein